MTTQKPAPKKGASAIIALFIFAIIGVIYLAMQPKYTKDIPKEDKPVSPFIDSLYFDTWEDVSATPDSVLSHLSQHNIPCGEIFVKESNSSEGSYLCACRTDVDDVWAFYQVWSNLSDVIPVSSYKVHNKPKSK